MTDRIEVMHRIVLLSVLNELPENPKDNAMELGKTNETSKQLLSVSQEQTLVEAFAFLASTTNDPRKVVAVAVEAHMADSLLLRIASNHGSLVTVQAGLKELGEILMRSARGDLTPEQNASELLFQAAVAMHQNRILVRLRSSHAVLQCNHKKEKLRKPKIIPQLYAAICSSRRRASASASATPDEHESLKKTVGSLSDMFLRLEKLSGPEARSLSGLEMLMPLLKACHRLHSDRILCRELNHTPTLDPDAKVKITSTLAKLSRYWTISKFLHRCSRESQQFQNFDVGIASYHAQPVPVIAAGVHTSQVIHRVCNDKHWGSLLSRRRLDSTERLSMFVSREAAVKSPVHAEIQLLWYYETANRGAQPRIIGSSKKACYLCNLFFRLHGEYFIPSTHGRLYTKWGLPELQPSTPRHIHTALRQFINAVGERLQDELALPQRLTAHPCESAIFPSAACSYTNASGSTDTVLAGSDHARPTVDSVVKIPDPNREAPTDDSTRIAMPSERFSNSTKSVNSPDVGSDPQQQCPHQADASKSILRPPLLSAYDLAAQEPEYLTFAAPIWRRMVVSTPPLVICTPRLQVTLTFEDGIVEGLRPGDRVGYWMEIQWFSRRDEPHADAQHSVADIAGMESGSELTLENAEGGWPWCIRLCYGGDAVSLTVHG